MNIPNHDPRMPVLFVGHGSPLNALSNNEFTQALSQLAQQMPRPVAVLMISAHWLTAGLRVEGSEFPPTIHDFSGFPRELYDISYPAPGAPKLAEEVRLLLDKESIELDTEWGLDHGAWSVLMHMYPRAEIPVCQLSLKRSFSLQQHLDLAGRLKPLREKGVLIVGSGNITHNLGVMDWNESAEPFAWAIEFDEMIKSALLTRNLDELLALIPERHSLWRLAHPSIDHYLPLLYAVGASDENEVPTFPYTGIAHGSLSMRAVKYNGAPSKINSDQ